MPLQARPLAPVDAADLIADLSRAGLARDEAHSWARDARGCVVRLDAVSPAEAAEMEARARPLGVRFVVLPSVHRSGQVDLIVAGLPGSLRELDRRIAAAVDAAQRTPGVLHLGEHTLDLTRRVAVMGILNVTPDSFFDGGRHNAPDRAVEHALRLVDEGADLLDVGGDSASGRAARIDAQEEIRRVADVIRALARQVKVPIAVDTHRAATAAASLDAGASMVNDITGLSDPEMAPAIARGGAGVCVMHIRGVPKEFPPDFDYATVTGDVVRFLHERTQRALGAGIPADRITVDPGIEFGKLVGQDLELMRRLPELQALGSSGASFPILVAVSRKDVIGNVLGGIPSAERLEGTAAAITFSIARGARIVRVHDVRAMRQVARMTEALMGWRFGPDDPAYRTRSDGVLVSS